jgi:hypothetical protein
MKQFDTPRNSWGFHIFALKKAQIAAHGITLYEAICYSITNWPAFMIEISETGACAGNLLIKLKISIRIIPIVTEQKI